MFLLEGTGPLFSSTCHPMRTAPLNVNKFFGQPDDGLHTGPKHVVVSYILLPIVILLCS
jgi:hypothetical protein